MRSVDTLNRGALSTQNHHQSNPVRRPALFLSPPPVIVGGSRVASSGSASPTTPRHGQNGAESPQPEVRLAVLGALGVGKSALVVKYITKRFIMEYDPFLEDVYTKTETLASRAVSVKIMDTSDSVDRKPERYLKWASGFIVVYAIVSRASFDQAAVYLDTVAKYQRLNGSDGPVVLIGNKADLERYRTVSRSEAEALAARFDCSYLETSAAEDLDSVTEAFGRILSDVVRLGRRQPSLQSLFISEDRGPKGWSKLAASSVSLNTAGSSADVTSKDAAGAAADKKDDAKQLQQPPTPSVTSSRRSAPGFKLFNKGFKIFN